jgi:alpha-tubulin suppressor-like RCC1 family protein/lysophospholipase L1-like esterase
MSMWRSSLRLLVVAVWLCLLAVSALGVSIASAEGITAFKAKPSALSSAGGEVTFSAVVPPSQTGDAFCSVSATPSYGGLPSPFRCGTSGAWPYVTVPPNNTAGPVTYQYTVTATYPGGATLTSKSATITVAQSPATTYVALGDSYSAGEGNPAKSPNSWVDRAGKPSSIENGCDRASVAYPELVSKWLPKSGLPTMSLRFLACSGATTEDVWNSGSHTSHGLAEANDKEWQQLVDTADLEKARIVTISIGGNDLDFADILWNCTVGPPLHYCNADSNDGWIADLQQNIGTLEPILRETYEEIEAKAPNAALYVVGYPDLFPGNASLAHQVACSLATGITEEGISYLIENQGRLTAAVEQAADEAGAHFVNPNFTGKNGFWGHDVCAGTSWFNGLSPIDSQYSYHPNKAGQKALAEDVKAEIALDPEVTGFHPLTGVSSVSGGEEHTCALMLAGDIDCWGSSGYGQLGDGTYTNADVPAVVSGVADPVSVSAGSDHTCALLSTGGVDCWGLNDYGQLGDETDTDSDVPVPVAGITAAVSVSAGGWHTCAVLSGGHIDCWGKDENGELGDGANTNTNSPVEVAGITNAVAVSADADHTCALLASHRIACWGWNADESLGDGTTEDSNVPVEVRGITNAVAVSDGWDHACALLSAGQIDCWGLNDEGELGNGTGLNSSTPVEVAGIASAQFVAAGGSDTCAVLAGGQVDCWGAGNAGQLGDGLQFYELTPVAVSGIATAASLGAGLEHTCAVLVGGTVDCWGLNASGELGDGKVEDYSLTPVQVR